MILPTRGKILATKISREKVLESGVVIPEKLKSEKIDNVARVLCVGSPARKDCYLCHDKTRCKPILKRKRCKEHGKLMPMTVRRGDIIHYKEPYAQRFRYEEKDYIFLTEEAVIAIERDEKIQAVGSMVIVKLKRKENVGKIILSDGAQRNEGEYHGEVVLISPGFPDKALKVGDKLYYSRDEGYKFYGYNDRQEYLAIKSQWCCGKENT